MTLARVAELIRGGEDIQVLDRETKQDLTAATMAQIIFEEGKQSAKLPVEDLCRIIRSGLPV